MEQTRAAYRTALLNDGFSTARRQAARGVSPEGALDHLMISPEALRRIEEQTRGFDAHADEMAAGIEAIRDHLANRRRWTLSFTGSDGAFRALAEALEGWAARMRDAPVLDAPPPFAPFAAPPREGLAGPVNVAHCVSLMPAPHLAHPDVPLFRLGTYLIRFDYLLAEIRFKGNAYGAGASHDDAGGVFFLYSYSDPRIAETLAVFDGLREFAAAAAWTQTDVDRAIIGSAREAEKPIRPAEATTLALARRLRGDTNELREQRYAAMRAATPAAIRETFLRQLDAMRPRAAVCVVSSREKLEAANRVLGDAALTISNILP